MKSIRFSLLTKEKTPIMSMRWKPDKEFYYLKPQVLKKGQLIRLGDSWDGGYVIPGIVLDSVQSLVSIGLGNNFSFEKEFKVRAPDISIVVYDHSVTFFSMFKDFIYSVYLLTDFLNFRFRLSQVIGRLRFIFSYMVFFSAIGGARHYRYKLVEKANSNDEVTLLDILSRTNTQTFLKMDIEGDEFKTLGSILDFHDRLVGACIEFHKVEERINEFNNLIKMLQKSFGIAHLHINNVSSQDYSVIPDTMEITFIKKEFLNSPSTTLRLPIPDLDYPNSPSRPDWQVFFP